MKELTRKELNEGIKYWCDIFGFREPDMPKPVKEAMDELWEENAGNSYCMMAEFEGKYYVALKYEYDRCFAHNLGINMDQLYDEALLKGCWLEENKNFRTCVFLLSKGETYHELIVLVPIDTPKYNFCVIAQICEDEVYNIVNLPIEERCWRAIRLAVRYGGIDGEHHKAWVIDQMVHVLAGERYNQIVADACKGEDCSYTYKWDFGIAP